MNSEFTSSFSGAGVRLLTPLALLCAGTAIFGQGTNPAPLTLSNPPTVSSSCFGTAVTAPQYNTNSSSGTPGFKAPNDVMTSPNPVEDYSAVLTSNVPFLVSWWPLVQPEPFNYVVEWASLKNNLNSSNPAVGPDPCTGVWQNVGTARAATETLSYTTNANGVITGNFPYGTGYYVQALTTLGGSNQITVSAWAQAILPAGVTMIPPAYARIVEINAYNAGVYLGGNAVNKSYQFIVDDGNAATEYGSCQGGTIDGKEHLIAGTFDGTNGWLYVDGNLVAGPCAFSLSANVPTGTVPVFIGTYADSPSTKNGLSGFWSGTIGGVRIYSRALFQADIQSIYKAQAR